MSTRLQILEALFDGPMSTPDLVIKLKDPRPPQRAQSSAGWQLRRMAAEQLVRKTGMRPGHWQMPPATIWEITDHGREWARIRRELNFIEKRGGRRSVR